MKVLLCPLSEPGYLYPALAIGRELRRGGDTVEVLGSPAASPAAAAAGLPLLDPAPTGFRAARWWPGWCANCALSGPRSCMPTRRKAGCWA